MKTKKTIHVFEKAGLGRAPFRFIGIETRRGPIDLGGGLSTGAPGQPMGTCKFCGTGIAECCLIKSADGNRFMVGNVCVGKTGDRGLIDETKRAVNKARNVARRAREAKRIRAAKALAEQPNVIAELRNHPHPNKPLADAGKTRMDFVLWMFENAGNAGMIRAARAVEHAAKKNGRLTNRIH